MSTFRRATLRAASAGLAVASVFLLATCDLSTLTQPSGGATGGGSAFDSTELIIGGGRTVILGGAATMSVTSSSVSLSNVIKRYYSSSPNIISVDSITGLMAGNAVGAAKLTAKILAPELGAGVTISQTDTVKFKGIRVTAPLATDSIQGLGQTRNVSVFGLNNSDAAVGSALSVDSIASRNATIVTATGTTVTAKKNGTAYVVAFFRGLRDSVQVRVRQVAKTITFPTTDYTARHVNFNLTVPLTVKDVADSIIAAPTVSWATKDTTKAVIGAATGVLKVKAVGITDSVFATVDTVKRGQKIIVAQVAGSLTKFQGDARSDTVAKNVTVVPTVTVLDSGLTPIVGTTVKFKTGLGLNALVVDTLPVTTDAQGRASPTSWKLGDVAGAGTNTLIATSGNQSATFTVSGIAGAPRKLGFSVQPTSAPVGNSIAPSIQVQVLDSLGNLIAGATNTITLSLSNNPGAATLGGTLSQAAIAGVATFNNITLSAAGSGYTLQASSGALQAAISNGVDAYGAKAALGFSTQPSGSTAGAVAPTVRVQVQDAGGNKVATATDSVTLAIGTNPGAGTLSGTVKTAAVAGVATFSNLSINNAGSGYTLTAAAPTLTGAVSSAFNVATVGAAAKVSFISQPSNVVAGSAMSPSFAVQIQDASGALVTSSSAQVTLSIDPTTNPTGLATVSGTPTVAASGGVATFSNVIVNRAGTGYKLIATVNGLTSATSSSFNVTPGLATKLGFFQGPTHTVVSTTIAPAVVVEVQDANGNRVTSGAVPVSLSLGTCAGPMTGGGAATTANGIATYSSLSVSATGSNCFLAVSTTAGLSSANSTTFNVVAVGGPVRIKFTTQPSSATAGVALNAGTVAVQDANGTNVASASTSVTIAVASGPTTSFSTTTGTTLTAAPTATFSSATFTIAGTYRLVVTANGYRPDTSAAFTITPAAATRANMLAQPLNSTAGVPFSPPVQAAIQDQFGNTVTSATGTITLTNAGTLNNGLASISGPVVNGVATFTGLAVRKAATSLLFCASSSGLSTFCSGKTFDVAAAPLSTLAFNVQPGTATISTTFPTTPQVSGQDSVGNTLTDFTGNVTVALTGGTAGATLSGTKTAAAVAGVAQFPGLSVDKSGTGFQLSASASGLSTGTSNAFIVNAGPATKLAWITQPAATTFFNAPLSATGPTLATIAVQDAAGNTVVSSNGQTIRLAVSVGPSTTFKANGNSVTTADFGTVNGVVALTANNLNMTTAGAGYQLVASSPFNGYTSATSTSFQVNATDVKSKLLWNNNPQDGTYNVALLGPSANTPNVFVVDQWNNLITAATDNISVAIGTDANPTTTLSGGGSVAAAGGGASFPGLTLNKAGLGYTLVASAAGLTSATSPAFNITSPGVVATGIVSNDMVMLGGNVYFTHGQIVKRVSALGGTVTNMNTSVNPYRITTDGTNIYWARQGASNSGDATIEKLTVSNGITTTLVGSLTSVQLGGSKIYSDGTNVYFVARNAGGTALAIKSVSVNGGAATDLVSSNGLFNVPYFIMSGGFIYFYDPASATIKRMTTAGGSVTTISTALSSTSIFFAMSGTTLLFMDGSTLKSIPNANTTTAVSPAVGIGVFATVFDLEVDGSNFYIQVANNVFKGAVASINGSTTTIISSADQFARSMIFDGIDVYFNDNSSRIAKIPK